MRFKLYDTAKRLGVRFYEYCIRDENQKFAMGILAILLLLMGVQIGGLITERKSYIYNDKGQLVAFLRSSTDSAESIPLRVKVSRNGKKTVKDVIVNVDGKKNITADGEAEEEEGESFQDFVAGIVSRLSDCEGRIIYLPLKEKDAVLSWGKQRSYSVLLIPLLFPMAMAMLNEHRKAEAKKEAEKKLSSVKKSLPRFCNLLLLMMGSGLIFEDAFNRIAKIYEEGSNDSFKSFITEVRAQCENTSDNTIEALTKKSKELKIRELSRLSGILESGQKKGTDMTSKLEMESELLWNERKNYAEERGRAAEVKLSFPLAVLLIVLIVVTAAPAMMEM
ncbi:MAG: type II secretion system F family protein [Clostridia bacterium]|nr:type II secretion system F family protein [Clostridia bacterium]